MIVVVASVFIEEGDKVLLIREQKAVTAGKYGLPGGKLEEGETVDACAIRECLEETGYQATLNNLLLISQKTHTHEGNTVVRFIFTATAQKITDKPELEFTSFDRASLPALLAAGTIRGKDISWLLQTWLDTPPGQFSQISFGLKLFT